MERKLQELKVEINKLLEELFKLLNWINQFKVLDDTAIFGFSLIEA